MKVELSKKSKSHLEKYADFSSIKIIGGENRHNVFLFGLSVVAVVLLIVLLPGWLPLIIFLVAAAIAFFAYRLDIGLLILAFFVPFSGLIINFANYDWSRGIRYLSSVDAPFVDLFAIVLLISLVLRKIVLFPKKESESEKEIESGKKPKFGKEPKKEFAKIKALPLILFFGAFVLANVLSVFAADYRLFFHGLKFLLRPIIFMYLMFVVLPNSIIQDAKIFVKTLKTFFVAGVLSGLMGLVSLVVVGPFSGLWHRATPFSIGGVAPLGFNHNLLAEVLVVMVPIGVYLVYQERVAIKRKLYFISTVMIGAVALLTFARTAWLVLGIELLVFAYLYKKQIYNSWVKKYSKQIFGLVLVLMIPIIMYMAAISTSHMVAGSTNTRIDLTRISWEYFKRSPIFGNGPGSFIPIVSETKVYFLEYGDALDAHGMLQKVIAENGFIGLATWLGLLVAVLAMIYAAFKSSRTKRQRAIMTAMLVMVVGAMCYQLLNTSYYNAKMWFPIGIALAVSQMILWENKKKYKSKKKIQSKAKSK